VNDPEPTPAERFREAHPEGRIELPYTGIETFLRKPVDDVADIGGGDAAVLGAPYDGAVSNGPGARYGPREIRRQSAWVAYLAGYKGGLTNVRTRAEVDFDALDLVDCGDVPVFPMDRELTAKSIEAHVATVAEQGRLPVLLGGDHYCTFPAFRGFAEGAGHDRVGLVQIDAHTDTADESELYGEHFHGSSTRRIAESAYADFEYVSQVGIRGYEAPRFFDFADEVGLSVFSIRDVERRGIREVVAEAIAAAERETDAVYVTFDVDAIDPSVAPATGTPEPGGLSAEQALAAVETLGASDAIEAFDLVEVAPVLANGDATARLAAYLVTTFLERQFAE
jgi:agmatinase